MNARIKGLFLTFFMMVFSTPLWAGIVADVHFESSDKKDGFGEIRGKLFKEGQMYRWDMNPIEPKQERVSLIANDATKKRYSILHDQKKYMELTAEKENRLTAGFFWKDETQSIKKAKQKGYSVKKLPNEKIEGYVCHVYSVKGNNTDKFKEGKAWFAKDLDGFLIKMIGTSSRGEKMALNVSNIQKKKLSPSIFQAPKGYARLEVPKAMFDHGAMMQELQRIQQLPPGQREEEMRKFQQKMQLQSQQMRSPAGKKNAK